MLEGRLYTDNMYNQENNFDVSGVTLNKSVSECADLFGISEDTVRKHIKICGENVYNQIIENYYALYMPNDSNKVNDESVSPCNIEDKLDCVLWNKMYKVAHTGNIFITKDSVSSIYRHGHVAVVQQHEPGPKYIVEANKKEEKDKLPPEKQVDRRLLSDFGSDKKSLCMVYPDTKTVKDREEAGHQTYWYAYESVYTYEANNTKFNAGKDDYRKLNCVGVAYRAYKYMANYDIIPQVGGSSILLPSQVYYSKNIKFKYHPDGTLMRTPRFEDVEWGF